MDRDKWISIGGYSITTTVALEPIRCDFDRSRLPTEFASFDESGVLSFRSNESRMSETSLFFFSSNEKTCSDYTIHPSRIFNRSVKWQNFQSRILHAWFHFCVYISQCLKRYPSDHKRYSEQTVKRKEQSSFPFHHRKTDSVEKKEGNRGRKEDGRIHNWLRTKEKERVWDVGRCACTVVALWPSQQRPLSTPDTFNQPFANPSCPLSLPRLAYAQRERHVANAYTHTHTQHLYTQRLEKRIHRLTLSFAPWGRPLSNRKPQRATALIKRAIDRHYRWLR